MSPTVLVSRPRNITATVPITIATNVEGTARVSFGKKWIMAIVIATITSISTKGVPVIHSPATLNCFTCDKKMTIARPFTNPKKTGWGTSLINLPILNNPKTI